MSEKRFSTNGYYINDTFYDGIKWLVNEVEAKEIVDVMNNLDMKARERSKALSKLQKSVDEQQELIEELQVSDEMGWKRAEHFEKKCPKELHNQKMYIKRLEYKVQKFKEENEDLREVNNENQLLHEENVKQCERWKKLYEIKDAEVTARVDALNRVCEYYTSEVLFKSDVDPNKAVKEVINRILNTEVE